MLIIFDIDGTLLGGEAYDWWAFDRALKTVLGFAPTPDFFSSLPDVTAESIVEAAMRARGREPDSGLVNAVRDAYLRFLGECHRSDPAAFSVRKGAESLLAHLSSVAGLTVAFATGDWRPTISLQATVFGAGPGPVRYGNCFGSAAPAGDNPARCSQDRPAPGGCHLRW